MTDADGIHLTDREHQVCLLVAELKGTAAIALELGISVRTVENYIYRAAPKLPGKGQPMKKIIKHFSSSRPSE